VVKKCIPVIAVEVEFQNHDQIQWKTVAAV